GPGVPCAAVAGEAGRSGLVGQLAAGGKAAPAELAAELWKRIAALVDAGHPRLAAEWLDKVATAAPPGPAIDEVRARAARLYLDRGEAAHALPHLEALVASPAPPARAHLALAQHHPRPGDRRRAPRHPQAV